MASLIVKDGELVVRLSAWERVAAFHGDVQVPLAAVREVAVEPHPWEALRGIRSPGTGLPRVIAYGVRRLTGDRPDFAAVLGNRSTLRVELEAPAEFGRLLVSVNDAEAAVSELRNAAGL